MSLVCSVHVCDECTTRYVYDEWLVYGTGWGGKEDPPSPWLEVLYPVPIPRSVAWGTDHCELITDFPVITVNCSDHWTD